MLASGGGFCPGGSWHLPRLVKHVSARHMPVVTLTARLRLQMRGDNDASFSIRLDMNQQDAALQVSIVYLNSFLILPWHFRAYYITPRQGCFELSHVTGCRPQRAGGESSIGGSRNSALRGYRLGNVGAPFEGLLDRRHEVGADV